jgi:hypothetical protein
MELDDDINNIQNTEATKIHWCEYHINIKYI